MENVKLNEGYFIPKLGLGSFDLKEKSISEAIDLGYRLIDTAWQYGNESEVGKAVKQSGIKREEIFITTKLWTDNIRENRVEEGLEESLKNLQTDYVDLYLIHWPAKGFEKAWLEMAKLKEQGKVRNIGVSNFNKHHFDELKQLSDIIPVLNQIERHPYFHNSEIVDYCQNNGILVQAWCPLGSPFGNLMNNTILKNLAEKYNKDSAQIILRWHIQKGILVIPRSVSAEHLKSNIDIFDFELSKDDMDVIDKLNTGKRIGADPDNFDF